MFFSLPLVLIATNLYLVGVIARSPKLIDPQKSNNTPLHPCGSFIEYVNKSENLHGYIKLKDVNLDENFKLIAEFGALNVSKKDDDEVFSSFDIFEDGNSPGLVLEITFGFVGPVPELVSITRDDVNICEKGC